MKSNIFIPKIINVGYQNRSNTYTGKLAYVIYTDEKGVLRKQASWNNWRDCDIEPDTYDNIPTSGFVLNKKVGGTQSHWNFRQTYCRVYDPRGFEIEITIENLLYILENTNSIVGKGLEGEFVYGWDGKELVLLPTCSPDYKEIKEYTDLIFSEETIIAKDLVVGRTYRCKDNSLYIYLGAYDTYEHIFRYNEQVKNKGKHLVFAHFKDTEELNNFNPDIPYEKYAFYITYRKSLPKKFFISTQNYNLFPYLSSFVESIEYMPVFYPVDMNNIKISFFTKEEFMSYVQNYLESKTSSVYTKGDLYFASKPHNGVPNNYCIRLDYLHYSKDSDIPFILHKCNPEHYLGRGYIFVDSPKDTYWLTEKDIEIIYNTYKPCYVDVFLTNGKHYCTTYEWLPTLKED